MDDLIDDDTFSLELPVFVICDESLAKQEDAFPIAGGLTADGAKVVYIFSDSDLAKRCIDDKREFITESCVISHIDDPFHVIAMLELAREKDYRLVAFDPATERQVTRGVFPIEYIIAQIKLAVRNQDLR